MNQMIGYFFRYLGLNLNGHVLRPGETCLFENFQFTLLELCEAMQDFWDQDNYMITEIQVPYDQDADEDQVAIYSISDSQESITIKFALNEDRLVVVFNFLESAYSLPAGLSDFDKAFMKEHGFSIRS